MGHPAKHPIDPDTGLCDICDREAIREIRLGRQPTRRVVYVDHEEDVIRRAPEEERVVYVQVRISLFRIDRHCEQFDLGRRAVRRRREGRTSDHPANPSG